MVQVGSFRLAVRDLGSGPPLLLVHGLGSSSLAFARVAIPLASFHRVIAVDLPGFGDSDKPKYRYTIPFYAQRLVRLLGKLGIERCAWAGHSMGAQISLWAAIHHPQHVDSLALAAPAGFETFTPKQRALMENTLTPAWVRGQGRRQLRDSLALAFHRMPREADWLLERRLKMHGGELEGYAHAFSQGVRAMLDAPVRHQLHEVRQPALVLFGDRDRLVPSPVFSPRDSPQSIGLAGAEAMGARSVLIKETGHLLPFERPERFTQELLQFLA